MSMRSNPSIHRARIPWRKPAHQAHQVQVDGVEAVGLCLVQRHVLSGQTPCRCILRFYVPACNLPH